MTGNMKAILLAVAAVALVAVACGGGDSDATPTPASTPTPEPTATPLVSAAATGSGIDTLTLPAAGELPLTPDEIGCLTGEVSADVARAFEDGELSPATGLAILPALGTCGIDLGELIAAGVGSDDPSQPISVPGVGELPISANQMACVFNSIDPATLSGFLSGEFDPATAADLAPAISTCGIDLAALAGLAAADGLLSGDVLPGSSGPPDRQGGSPVLPGVDGAPLVPKISEIPGLDALPFGQKELACLADQLTASQVEALTNGELSALDGLALLPALSACGIDAESILGR